MLFQNRPFLPIGALRVCLSLLVSPAAFGNGTSSFFHAAGNGYSLAKVVTFSVACPEGAGCALFPRSGVLLSHSCFLLAMRYSFGFVNCTRPPLTLFGLQGRGSVCAKQADVRDRRRDGAFYPICQSSWPSPKTMQTQLESFLLPSPP